MRRWRANPARSTARSRSGVASSITTIRLGGDTVANTDARQVRTVAPPPCTGMITSARRWRRSRPTGGNGPMMSAGTARGGPAVTERPRRAPDGNCVRKALAAAAAARCSRPGSSGLPSRSTPSLPRRRNGPVIPRIWSGDRWKLRGRPSSVVRIARTAGLQAITVSSSPEAALTVSHRVDLRITGMPGPAIERAVTRGDAPFDPPYGACIERAAEQVHPIGDHADRVRRTPPRAKYSRLTRR